MKRFVLSVARRSSLDSRSAQERDVVVTGGWLFTSTSNDRVRNPGILIRGGKFLRVGGDLSIAAQDAQRVVVADTETVIPGLFDLHAHYAIELFNAGRKDETVAYPVALSRQRRDVDVPGRRDGSGRDARAAHSHRERRAARAASA